MMQQYESGDGLRWHLSGSDLSDLRRQLEAIDQSTLTRFELSRLRSLNSRLERDHCSITDDAMSWLIALLEKNGRPELISNVEADELRAQIRAIISGADESET